jgi:UDP-glucuronate 4-epimerase
VLVTGGAGFIGSHLVDSLLADGHHVTISGQFRSVLTPSVKEANIEPHRGHPARRLVEADLRDVARLQ